MAAALWRLLSSLNPLSDPSLLNAEVAKLNEEVGKEPERLQTLSAADQEVLKAWRLIKGINESLAEEEAPALNPSDEEQLKIALEELKVFSAALHSQALATETNELLVAQDDLNEIDKESEGLDNEIFRLTQELEKSQAIRTKYAQDIAAREKNILRIMTMKMKLAGAAVQPTCHTPPT
jgi:chromosome segregation ATPase